MIRRSGLWLAISLVTVAVLFWLGVIPPGEKLRFGKDLRGGVSITYSVRIEPGDDPKQVLSALIEVLKERIDPMGQMDISITPQGRDRIEITMPTPSATVQRARAEIEAKIASIGQGTVTAEMLGRAERAGASERESVIAGLSQDEAVRRLLRESAEASSAASAARAAYEAARTAGAPAEEQDRLVAELSRAELAFDEVRERAQGRTITAEQVKLALRKSAASSRKFDHQQNKRVELPSERDRAFASLAQEFPEHAAELASIRAEYEQYEARRRTLDDPDDLIRLLRGAGVLDFRITVQPGELAEEDELRRKLEEQGPRNARSSQAAWFKINRLENWFESLAESEQLLADPAGYFAGRRMVAGEYRGGIYVLCWDTPDRRLTRSEGDWKVSSASRGVDQIGRTAIDFRMDSSGARLLADLTGQNLQRQMAVMLDDEVITAPTLQGRISSNGQISGDFPEQELTYIIRTLNAGSLQAKLSSEPIGVNEIGPDLGLDNLQKGYRAGIVCLVVTSMFMVLYYFPTLGGAAVVSLLVNASCIIMVMGLNRWTFTMPGIAGVILTFGMAVDSNVLVYERMREEARAGENARNAIRLGFSKAMSSIVDGNITNLIVCLVLLLPQVSTPEIRGFAITMSVGVVTTLFCALVINKLVLGWLFFELGWRKYSMLPMAVPAVDRALEPRIDWVRLRWAFVILSTVYVALGLAMAFGRGVKMLDIDFRAGTQLTLAFKADAQTGERSTLTRREVEDRVHAIGERATDVQLQQLRSAEILPLNPQSDGITSDRFVIRTLATPREVSELTTPIVAAFSDVMDVRVPVSARGLEVEASTGAPVYPISRPRLGENISRTDMPQDVRDWLGGVVVVLEGMEPAISRAELEDRLREMREQRDFSDISGRRWEVRVLEGTDAAVRSAALLARDSAIGYFEDGPTWQKDVAQREWELVREALQRPAEVAGVQSFSPAVAQTFAARAVVAMVLSFVLVGIYIWVRFGGLRYSLAAIVCVLHDVLTVLGLVALCEILYDIPSMQRICQAIGILPFRINLDLVAAMLTVLGYSLNDTIIVMDRIRENKGRRPRPTVEIVNLSINQTMSRTVITSGTTLLACLMLYMFGGEGIRGFAFALLVGIGVGTYSSIAVAAQIVVGILNPIRGEPEPGPETAPALPPSP